MRYTTVIDISEAPKLYRNKNTRLVYLHLVLKSGYHDHDRDMARISVRELAWQTGLSVAAVRNATAQLIKWQLLRREGDMWHVRKWVPQQPISERPKSKRQTAQAALEAERRAQNERREREQEVEMLRRQQLEAQGKTSYMVYYESRLEKAKAGDVQEQEWCRKNEQIYLKHKAAMEGRKHE